MNGLIDAAFDRKRTVIFSFILIMLFGLYAYLSIPKEAEPDIPIPVVYISMTHEGIAPGDAERLLLRPMEKELQSIEGIKEMRSQANEGYASITIEFFAGFDSEKAIRDVREKVDIAKSELPPDTDEPRVIEINVALFPVLTVMLSGDVPEQTLVAIARKLEDHIEALPNVLEVDIGGDREEVMEIILDPAVLKSFDISFETVVSQIQRNNQLVAAGSLMAEEGNISLKVPGVIENIEDVLSLPVIADGQKIVTFADVAEIKRTFKAPLSIARLNGQPAVALEIKKRVGANIIETIASVRALVDTAQAQWGGGIRVHYMQDKSEDIKTMLGDLQNNVITAVVLVMIIILAALGPRPSALVGLAIPGSFLAGILIIYFMGFTINIVVLFSLILVVGMLVDGAIVTIELADRRQALGVSASKAYAGAAKRMAWPIIASTATTLSVFFPLVFWPGVVGEFMKFLPITVIITLTASLFMALVFIPVIGSVLMKKDGDEENEKEVSESQDDHVKLDTRDRYYQFLNRLLNMPGKVLVASVVLLVGAISAYSMFGKGTEFFPKVEPDFVQVQIRARGDMSIYERDVIVRSVERKLMGITGIQSLYARTSGANNQSDSNVPEDTIGVIQVEFFPWGKRPPTAQIIQEIRELTAQFAGVYIQVQEEDSGPSAGKPVQLVVSSPDQDALYAMVDTLLVAIRDTEGFTDVDDSRPPPGTEWSLMVDREQAARFGADVSLLGQAVQLVTNGIMVGTYRPDDADDEVDIRIRFPQESRTFNNLLELNIPTVNGAVPASNFVTFIPEQKTGRISRIDSRRAITIGADVVDGYLASDQVKKVAALLSDMDVPSGMTFKFKGEDQDSKEAGEFLGGAFITAIFLMLVVLLTQFNSFYQAFIILSAIVFSTAGVFLGLLITGRPFGIVMVGIGIIALAGIVVNNNIVLIDTYNAHRKTGMPTREAILRTCLQRRRPVLLTSITTVLGLIPMVFAMNVDLLRGAIAFGAPSTQWWTELSSAIAGGLTFATLLTLLLTPCLLMLGENMSQAWRQRRSHN